MGALAAEAYVMRMRPASVPTQEWSRWVPWSERTLVADRGRPGVYMLADFQRALPRGAAKLCPQVLYIGETTRQTLHIRIRDFGHSAFSGREAHAGGKTFFREFQLRTPPRWLHIAAVAPDGAPPVLGALIKHIEREMIWQYAHRFGSLPRCNSV